ncbi:sigma-70 family RNA polymerase sigma factor [Lentisphaerota bacterium WC36G]|nr:sigma-70 family RNA polymerase sigma factor [Lentisphaerae bacterium WC36]
MKKYSDEELINAVKNGENHFYSELIARYSQLMLTIAYGVVNNQEDAEEVVQDAFIKAFNGLESFRGDAQFKTWLQRIVLNLAHNKFHWNRRRGKDVNLSLTAVDSDGGENNQTEIDVADIKYKPDAVIEEDERNNRIIRSFEKLPDNLREVMVLRHLEDLSYEEIANIVQCKVGTVKSRISRGREMLKKILKEVIVLAFILLSFEL